MKQNIDRKSSHFITIPYLKLGKCGIMIGVLAVLDTIRFTWVLLKEWRVCWFIIIGKLFLQFIFTALFRELNHNIFSFLWDTYVHILWYFCLWQSHVILQTKAYICFYKNRISDDASIQPRFVRNLKEHVSQRFWLLFIVFSLFIVGILHIIVCCQLYICSWAIWLIALIKYHIIWYHIIP